MIWISWACIVYFQADRSAATKKTKESNNEDGDIQSDYDFVNITTEQKHIDRDLRTKIRKRVMINHMRLKGLNLQASNEHSRLPATRINSLDPFDIFPFRLEPYMHDLLKYCQLYLLAHLKDYILT